MHINVNKEYSARDCNNVRLPSFLFQALDDTESVTWMQKRPHRFICTDDTRGLLSVEADVTI